MSFTAFRNIAVKTVDTDVITLLLARLSLRKIEIEADFNFGKERRFRKIKDLCSRITPEQQLALMFLFILTSCFLIYQKVLAAVFGVRMHTSLKLSLN